MPPEARDAKRPILIVLHQERSSAGRVGHILEQKGFSLDIRRPALGDELPSTLEGHSGTIIFGGPMSANDELPWIGPLLELLRNAVRQDVPVIGHCLGGQLMSRAFGGAVRLNPVREIGWGQVRVADNGVARAWLGELQSFETFQWHGETFSIPPGATRVLEGEHCLNQAFGLGRHFAMQCHVEMTPELVRTWMSSGGEEIRAHKKSPAVQAPAEIEKNLEPRLDRLHQVADRIYDRWSEGLSRGS